MSATQTRQPQATRRGQAPAPGLDWSPEDQMCASALALVTLLTFFPILMNEFVNWDDDKNFLENFSYRGLSPAHIRWAWTSGHLGVYQPLGWIFLGAEYAWSGMSPRGYHAMSLIFHAAGVILLYLVARVVLTAVLKPASEWQTRALRLAAAVSAAFYAVHPLRAEPVAWVSAQTYLPCTAFYLAAVAVYLVTGLGPRKQSARDTACVFLLFLAALLCKAFAVTLPAVLVLLDVVVLKRLGADPRRWLSAGPGRRWLLQKVPFFGLSLVFALIAILVRGDHDVARSVPRSDVVSRLAATGDAAVFYAEKTVLPVNLTVLYPAREASASAKGLVPVASACALLAGLACLWPRTRGALAAVVPFLIAWLVILSPHLGLFGGVFLSDRYTHLAHMPLAVLGAAITYRVLVLVHERPSWARWRIPLAAVTGLACLTLGLLTWQQCLTWRTSESLWSHALQAGGDDFAEAHIGLADALLEQGRVEESLGHYDRARSGFEASLRTVGRAGAPKVSSVLASIENNEGLALLRSDKPGRALESFRKAIPLQESAIEGRPTVLRYRLFLSNHWYNAGLAHQELKQTPEAARSFERARELRQEVVASVGHDRYLEQKVAECDLRLKTLRGR